MKLVTAVVTAVMLAGFGCASAAQAQGLPPGSYLGSCTGAAMRGDTLIASCRRIDGSPLRTALAFADRCVGDIGNNDGVLQCMFRDGAVVRGQIVAQPGYRPPPAYAAPPAYAPPPPYRESERCRELRHRAHELRERMERAFDPISRGRIETRLREVYTQQWYAGCRYD